MDFEKDVIQRSFERPVMAVMSTTWCGPCKVLKPFLTKLQKEHGGAWDLQIIDVEDNPETARAYRIRSVPTVMVFVKGQPVTGFRGIIRQKEILEMLNGVLV